MGHPVPSRRSGHAFFVGSRDRADEEKRVAIRGGIFVLAAALFAVFDHLGACLAKWNDDPKERESLDSNENIARVARCLKSTRDMDAIVTNLGRNALVNELWP